MTEQALRWGVLGTARIATKVGAAIHAAKGAELSCIASRDLARAQEWANEHGAARSCGSYEALLEDPEIDAVYIPLPPSLHADWTTRAAEHGKHVLCEKPLAATAAAAAEMVAACEQHDVQLMDGVMWLHHPRALQMRELLPDLGTLRHLASAFTFCWPELPQAEFRLERQYGGGSLLDLGWYCVGAALWAFGEMPERVFGAAHTHGDVDMHFNGLMFFPGERTASLDCGFDTVMRRWLEIAGTEAALICEEFTRPWQQERPVCRVHSPDGTSVEHVSANPVQEVCMIEAFSAALSRGERVPEWPTRALQTQIICEALDESARTGRVVEVPGCP